MVYEGVYYAAGADILGGVVALLLAVTVLKDLELAIYVVLYYEYHVGSGSGHRCALSVAGCGHSADCTPLL